MILWSLGQRSLQGHPRRPGPTRAWRRGYASSSSTCTVLGQLGDVAELMSRVGRENSPKAKADIIQQYPQLRDLLELVYDPRVRLFNSSQVLRKSLRVDTASTPDVPETILELFDRLSTRQVTGHAARDMLVRFIRHHRIASGGAEPGQEDSVALNTFFRLLDRNLAAGFGARTLAAVPWPDRPAPLSEPPSKTTGPSSPSPSAPSAESATCPGRNLRGFSCALGKTIEPPFKELLSTKHKWYASRKLDGVRVLALLDFVVPNDRDGPIEFAQASLVSRSGNPFYSLKLLEEQLCILKEYPKLREIFDRDPTIISSVSQGVVKRLVLDGEVCLMIPSALAPKSRTGDDGTGASALWEDEGLVESFHGALSAVKRSETMAHPVYFVFDVLPWVEVDSHKHQQGPGLGRVFGQRAQEAKEMVDWFKTTLEAQGQESKVRALVQWPIQPGDIEGMVERAAAEGWEGLIFRADKPYEGRRTKDVYKFKKWHDAEYTVLNVEISNVRLGVNGEFGFYNAVVSLEIEHKGYRVSVGSGFTAEERIRWAQNPSSIIGKQVTVEYFSESTAADRSKGISLRFPRLKTVWEEGKRTI